MRSKIHGSCKFTIAYKLVKKLCKRNLVFYKQVMKKYLIVKHGPGNCEQAKYYHIIFYTIACIQQCKYPLVIGVP
jgi:hypothetical protein